MVTKRNPHKRSNRNEQQNLKKKAEQTKNVVDATADEVKESEYRCLFNTIPSGVAVYKAIDDGADFVFVDFNPTAEKIDGVSKRDILGKRVTEVFPGIKDFGIFRVFQRVYHTGETEYFPNRVYKDKIVIGWRENWVYKLPNNIIVAIYNDVSERKKAEAELRERDEKYLALVDQSLQGILIGRFAPFRFVFANKPVAKILGYSVDELKTLSPVEIKALIHPDDILRVLERFRKGLLGKKVSQRLVFRMVKKNGQVCWVDAFFSFTADAGEPAVQAIFVDVTERKQLENALRTSEEMFRAISTSAMDAIVLLDGNGKVTYWNPAAERIFGYSNGEAVGKAIDALIISPKYKGLHSKSAIKAFKNGRHHKSSMDFKALRKNGSEVPIELTVSVLEIKDKKHLLGIIRDTSKRKKIEATLRDAEKRYHMLFDKAPLGIMVCDETATAVEFNEEVHRQLGYTREEFAKLTVSDYEVLETPEEIRARIQKILHEGKDEFETKHRTKNGEIRDVIVTVQLVEIAGKKLFHLITRDVTEQKKIERELKIEKEKLEAVTENIGAGLGIISKDYSVVWANKLLMEQKGKYEGKKCYSTFNQLTDVCPDCGVKKIFEGSVSIDIREYSNLDDQGNRYWLELIATPLKDENGNVIAALELAVNITERKIMQNQLAEYSQKLEKLVEKRTAQLKAANEKLLQSERLAAIGELAAMVGHDLRNPLTGMKNAAYYLEKKGNACKKSEKQMLFKVINSSIDYANKVVNDLLEYSGNLNLELEEKSPKTLLSNALSMIQNVPEKTEISIQVPDALKINVDEGKIVRVFANLMQNAIDAMPNGGVLNITARQVKSNIKISFADTGEGIPEELTTQIFTPLFTTKAKGMGFGLSICKRIIEAHRGNIDVESKLDHGTTFNVTLPMKTKTLVGS